MVEVRSTYYKRRRALRWFTAFPDKLAVHRLCRYVHYACNMLGFSEKHILKEEVRSMELVRAKLDDRAKELEEDLRKVREELEELRKKTEDDVSAFGIYRLMDSPTYIHRLQARVDLEPHLDAPLSTWIFEKKKNCSFPYIFCGRRRGGAWGKFSERPHYR